MKGFIYVIKENKKVLYVGSTQNFERRKRQHFKEDRKEKMQAIHKYMRSKNNEGFSVEVIKEVQVNNVKELQRIEKRFIDKFDTVNNGFNLHNGTRNGTKNSNARAVKCLNDGRIFATVSEACQNYGFNPSELASHLTGKRYLNGIGTKKFGTPLMFEYLDREADKRRLSEETLSRVKESNKKRNSIAIYCGYNNKTYSSLKELSKDVNENYSSLSTYLKGNGSSKFDYLKIKKV